MDDDKGIKAGSESETLGLIDGLETVVMSHFAVVGSHTRFDEGVRQGLKDARARIVSGFLSRGRRENHLVWAAPGSGKTYFVEQIVTEEPGVGYRELNLAKLDEAAFRDGLEQLRTRGRPLVCLIDEVDAKPETSWPFELLLPALDANLDSEGGLVFVLAGSSGASLVDFKERIAARPKGVDLLSRVPQSNDCVIAPMNEGDKVLVAVSQMLNAARATGRSLEAVEKLALYYIACSPHLANARQLREFAVRALERGASSDDRVKFDDLFDSGDPENKRFWVEAMPAAASLVNSFVSVDARPKALQSSAPAPSGSRPRLPKAAWPLIGRETELQQIRQLVVNGVQLLTLTGPGGSGKTRLALEAAIELEDDFPDGVFFASLAPLRDVAAARSTISEAVGLRPDDDLLTWLKNKRLLLVLDNLEQLRGIATVVSELLVGDLVILATSRAPLHLSAERELSVEPLPDQAASELFVLRAGAAGRQLEPDEIVTQVCQRLDNLPLALDLAAARTKLLTPAALLRRLDAALPLLTTGAADLPERQQTLRATIGWSHDLLNAQEQAALRRLSVFRGSFTLNTAEAVARAGLDDVAGLLDQSLIRPLGDDRFFQLETIREFAREQLDQAGETNTYALRHGRYYLGRLAEIAPVLRGPRTAEFLAWYGSEEDNLRAMLDRLTELAPDDAARAAIFLSLYWVARGRIAEGVMRLRTISLTSLPQELHAEVLERIAYLEEYASHLDEAEAAAIEAQELAERAGSVRVAAAALGRRAMVANQHGDSGEAVRLGRLAVEQCRAVNCDRLPYLLGDLGLVLSDAGEETEARAVLGEAVEFFRRSGDRVNEANSLSNLARLDTFAGDYAAALAASTNVRAVGREIGHQGLEMVGAVGMGVNLLSLERRDEARRALGEALDLVLESGWTQFLYYTLGLIARSARRGDLDSAARLLGAVTTLSERDGISTVSREPPSLHVLEQRLAAQFGEGAWARERAAGATLTLDEMIVLAREILGSTPE